MVVLSLSAGVPAVKDQSSEDSSYKGDTGNRAPAASVMRVVYTRLIKLYDDLASKNRNKSPSLSFLFACL